MDLLTFNAFATSLILHIGSFKASFAIFSFSDVSDFGLPPNLPLAFAAFSPARVLSRKRSLSCSASKANIPKINLPFGVVVSNKSSVRLLTDIAF